MHFSLVMCRDSGNDAKNTPVHFPPQITRVLFLLGYFLTIFATSLLSESLAQFVSCLNFFPLLSGSVFIMRIFCFPVSSLNRSQRHFLIEYFLRKPDLYPSFISSKIKWLLNFEQAIFAWWIFIDRNTYARLLRALNRQETSSPLQSESHGPSVARTCKSKQKLQQPFSSVIFILINRVTSNGHFYDGHLVMRSKRCAVQNQ